ncbi:class II glutamine amidotransferase [Paratractidigestivibacter sp.]|uniref:class II glutamine amidotransferase n=1 Tax=Paratractidigestivibacter sp. TaxID=2847316 RepID=UPI002ABE665D|nr:class II glutamine amidotransferase [Paratractidigestivibacter sp.]
MCELFAVNAARPVEVGAYLKDFFSHSKKHKDGWGISWRVDATSADGAAADATDGGEDDTDVFLHREPVPAWTSAYIPALLEGGLSSSQMEAHIRLSTCGQTVRENCHPFYGTDVSGREWTLIHNGILFNEELLATYDLKEVGQTDSERALLFLLDVIDEAAVRSGGILDFPVRFQALSGAVSQISNLNRLNLIIDDGEYTYVHTNTNVDSLHFRQLGEDAIVFSTQPLGGEGEADFWRPVPKNRLIAYKDGRLVRTSTPHGYVFCEAILDLRRKFGDAWTSVLE